MKKDYWKSVSSDGITIICVSRADALENAERAREDGNAAYVRKIRMTEAEFSELNEYD
jgi:hypothetical protein